jgi:hypothetical protein
MANSQNANLAESIHKFQETLCIEARTSVRRSLTDSGVARSPALRDEQMRNIMDLLVDPANGYFNAEVTGDQSFTLKERRKTPNGYDGWELEVMVSFESVCDSQRVAKAHGYGGEGLVLAPNCDTARIGRGHCHCEPLFEMLGSPLEFLAMVLPRFVKWFNARESYNPADAIGSPFSPELKFDGHGYGWHVQSACADAIADRDARTKAIEAVSRVVCANLERIKAKLWRPHGTLCAKMRNLTIERYLTNCHRLSRKIHFIGHFARNASASSPSSASSLLRGFPDNHATL